MGALEEGSGLWEALGRPLKGWHPGLAGSTLEKKASDSQSLGYRVEGVDFIRDQSWCPGELLQVPGLSWVLRYPGCGKAGERAESTCAIDVGRLKRRPPVGGLCHEFRVQGLGFRF